jgi:ribosomal protein L14E/L6E/L27E
MGISCENDGLFPLGALVVIKRGKHVGSVCAVVGNDKKSGKILIANGVEISAKKPKRKNIRHLGWGNTLSPDVADRLARGKIIDDGWLKEVLRRLK